MSFYWILGAVVFGIPIAAALLYVRRPRLGARLLATWIALFGVLALVVIGTTLSATSSSLRTGDIVRAAIVVTIVVALFGALATGLWRERRWALYTVTALLTVAVVSNVVLAARENASLERATVVSYLTVLPAMLFMCYRAMQRRSVPAPHP
jgi:hypothetical protein